MTEHLHDPRVVPLDRRIYVRALGLLAYIPTGDSKAVRVPAGQECIMDSANARHLEQLEGWLTDGRAEVFTDINEATPGTAVRSRYYTLQTQESVSIC